MHTFSCRLSFYDYDPNGEQDQENAVISLHSNSIFLYAYAHAQL